MRRRTMGLLGLGVLLVAGAVVALVGEGGQDGAAAAAPRAAQTSLPPQAAGTAGAALMGADASGATASGAGTGDSSGVGVGVAELERQAAVAQVPSGRDKVIKRAELHLEIKKGTFATAFDEAARVASRLGGFVASSSSNTSGDRLTGGSLVLRVPADRFDEARAQLGRLGKIERQQASGEEVGAQLVDLGARLTSLRAQEEALRGLMTRARTVGETLQVQEQLGLVRQQIEQLAAQQAQLQDAVGMATIQVGLAEPGIAVSGSADEPSGLGHSFERALDGAEAVVGGTIVVTGYAVPLALLALLGWLGVRIGLARRRRPATVTAA